MLDVPLGTVIEQARAEGAPRGSPWRSSLHVEAANRGSAALVIVRFLQAQITRDSTAVTGIEGELFLRLR